MGMTGAYDADPARVVAKLALNARTDSVSDALRGVIEYCFIQLEYRQTSGEMLAFAKELSAPYEGDA